MSLTVEDRVFSDYELGERYQGMARTIDQSDINTFAGLTLDLHPAHLDHEFAAPRYGGRLAHGMLTFALVTGLTVEYNLRAISYGYDKVRFPGPVLAGDTVRAAAEVVDLADAKAPTHGLVTKQYTGTVGDRVVFVCRHILAVERRRS